MAIKARACDTSWHFQMAIDWINSAPQSVNAIWSADVLVNRIGARSIGGVGNEHSGAVCSKTCDNGRAYIARGAGYEGNLISKGSGHVRFP